MLCRRFIAFTLLLPAAITIAALPARGQSYTVARGLAYERARDWQGLLRYATAWSQAQPNSIDAWALVGSAYSLGFHEPDKAIAPLRRCVAIDPNSAPAWHALGTAYTQTKQLGPAVDAFKRAIQLNPNQPTYYNNLAAAYSEGNAVKSAMNALDQERVLAERLNNANVWYTLGNGYAQLTDVKNAIASYRRLLAISPGFAQGWTNLGVALEYDGDISGARSAYRRGSQLGDPLASRNAAQMEAGLRAQTQQQSQSANNGMRANAVAGMLYRMNH